MVWHFIPLNQKLSSRFVYTLPDSVGGQINKVVHTFVQKQLGVFNTDLTLDIDFNKKIQSANPAEMSEKWGDMKYEIQTDLVQDREFKVNF